MGLTNVPPYVVAPALYNYDECDRYPGAVADGRTVYRPCKLIKLPYRYVIVQVDVWISVMVEVEVKVVVHGKVIVRI